jgi:hypothetical protein
MGMLSIDDVVAIIFFTILMFGLVSLIHIINRLREKKALQVQQLQAEEAVALEKTKEERREEKKECISNGLIVREWASDNPPDESTEGDQDTPPSGDAVEAQQPPAPPINSSPAFCAMGSDDCESLAGEEEMEGCAICLCHFKPQELVCQSSSSSCQHVFHKDCMVDWLMKDHDTCPMCREAYVLKAV